MNSGITVISFDGDDTLWDFEKLMRHALRFTLEELQSQIKSQAASALSIDKMIEIRDAVGRECKGQLLNLKEVRLMAFRRTLDFVGASDASFATRLNDTYVRHRFEDVKLYDDVMPTFAALSPHFVIGLISNANSYPKHCGLEDVFRFALFAHECGFEKPDPGMFNIAFEKTGCSKDEFIHVGNSLEDDVVGARNAGIKSVWLNRHGAENTSEIEPDAEISSLTELIDLL
jgi:HAD superfamily hydrolase (TIGR01509 family)